MTIAEQIATYLNAQSIATYSDAITSKIFIGQLPDGSDIYGIYTRPGKPIESDLGYKSVGIQIIYRGTLNPIASQVEADTCFDALQGYSGKFVTGQNYIVSCLSKTGSNAYCLGTTEKGYFEYTMNFLVEFKI